jgi:hypothetical protein
VARSQRREPSPAPPSRPGEPVGAARPGSGDPVPAAKPRPGEPVPPAEPGSSESAAAAKSRPGEPSPATPKPFSVWEKAPKPSQEPGDTPGAGRDSRRDGAYEPGHAEPPSADTEQKLEQLKDLYLTAQAIGEDALDKHFDQVSEMQRSLIREFFEKAGLASKGKPKLLGDGSAQDDASLPG